MKVEHTDFICLPVTDFERSKDFYENTLGIEFSHTWGDLPAGEFETGNVTLALMQPDAFGLEFKPHSLPIAFRVDDVAARKEELEAKGVKFQSEIIDSGVCHQAIFTDPDGNALNLHHRYAGGAPTKDVEVDVDL
ncbi:MAG: VOC family protein [Actinomycetota bacterium]|nr:VOC family protein [Actinomycetota bacterium]